ncbi:MAG: hypothetical protein JO115_13865 [Pseudonocardiales bacterium]|nr:hypothetical protein [Pseudonocardiales bacterium]
MISTAGWTGSRTAIGGWKTVSQRRLEDNQQWQFEQLSTQIAEILGLLRGPATPESER